MGDKMTDLEKPLPIKESLDLMILSTYEVKTNDKFLDERFEKHKVNYGHYWYYYRAFYHLAELLQPKLVVELGGYQGTAAAHFASGCSNSTVITIDHHTDEGDDINQVKMWEVVNRYSNVKYLQGWTTKFLADREGDNHHFGAVQSAYPRVIEIMDEIGAKIDILFIDSWHHYKEAMNDWRVYRPLLSNPSLIICDDIESDKHKDDPINGMMKFWDELPGKKYLDYDNLHPGTSMGFMIYET